MTAPIDERHDALDLEHRRQAEQREQDRVDRDHDQPERLQDVRKEQKLERRPYQSGEDAEDGREPQDRQELMRRVKLEPGQEHDQQPDDDRVREELNERDPPAETRQAFPASTHVARERPPADSTREGPGPHTAGLEKQFASFVVVHRHLDQLDARYVGVFAVPSYGVPKRIDPADAVKVGK